MRLCKTTNIMVYCVAFGCNASSAKGGGIHLFSSPDPILLKKWLTKTKRTDFKPTKYSQLCSAHFAKSCFTRDPDIMAALGYPGARISLESSAVPTVFQAVEAIHKRQASPGAGSSVALSKLKASRSRKRSASASVASDGSVYTPITPSVKSSSSRSQIPSANTELMRSAYRKRQRIKVLLACYVYD